MRMVQITTDVFAAIWADRQPGEESENEIIARRFGLKLPAAQQRDIQVSYGWQDAKHGVKLPVGFQIHRAFKGKEYTAQAIQGFWVSSHDGNGYPTLNDLSTAIGARGENAWWYWWCKHPETGAECRVSDLRDPDTIRKVKD